MNNFATENSTVFFMPSYTMSMYYKCTEIHEYCWRRLMKGGSVNVGEILKDEKNITLPREMPADRFLAIISGLESLNGNLFTKYKEEFANLDIALENEALDSLFDEEDCICEEEEREVYDIGCCYCGDLIKQSDPSDYISLCEWKEIHENTDFSCETLFFSPNPSDFDAPFADDDIEGDETDDDDIDEDEIEAAINEFFGDDEY